MEARRPAGADRIPFVTAFVVLPDCVGGSVIARRSGQVPHLGVARVWSTCPYASVTTTQAVLEKAAQSRRTPIPARGPAK